VPSLVAKLTVTVAVRLPTRRTVITAGRLPSPVANVSLAKEHEGLVLEDQQRRRRARAELRAAGLERGPGSTA
jgi:hypothetical protein